MQTRIYTEEELTRPPARRNYLSSAYPPRFGAGYGGGEKT